MKNMVVIGEVLVDILADTLGEGFHDPQPLTGPFPSGAPAIFADQAAKLGQPVGIISCVGDDDFGRINIKRLAHDGVDISAIHIDHERPTGSAFVRYQSDGSRDFVFNIKHSACRHLHITPSVKKLLERADHLHVMGSSLFSDEFIELNIKAAEAIKARGGTVSFDPNLRKELLSAHRMADTMTRIVAMTDLFLPSGEELTLLTESDDEAGAISELLRRGVQIIVHKNGVDGASYHDANGAVSVASFPIEEVDPTGAGDCFGAVFTTLWLRGAAVQDALTMAAAAGALAVAKRGPMAGVSDMSTIQHFIRSSAKIS